MTRALVWFVLAVSVAACSTARRNGCRPSMLLDRIQGQVVYMPCAVDRPIAAAPQTTYMEFDAGAAIPCYRAAIDVVVSPEGEPLMHTARLVSSTDPGYADRVMDVIRDMRFRPAMKNGLMVHQLVRVERMQSSRITPGRAQLGCS
jgi:hypothetical protein